MRDTNIIRRHALARAARPGTGRQRGFSLIELMVAMAIGLVLALGIVQVVALNKQSYRILESTNFAQENARYAFDVVGNGLLMADHWGGVEASEVEIDATAGSGGCDTDFVIPDPLSGVAGFDGATDAPLACIEDYESDTDVVVVRYADPNFIPSGGALDGGRVYLRAAVGERGVVALGADVSSAGIPDAPGNYTFPYRADVYFVRQCSDRGSNDSCDDTDDGGNPIPTLTRLTLQADGTYAQEALVEGVEQMQIEYGVDSDGDAHANYYGNATAVAAANDWDSVVSARMSVLVRGTEVDISVGDVDAAGAARSYSLSDDTTSFTPESPNYLRRHITSLLQVRNRNRG